MAFTSSNIFGNIDSFGNKKVRKDLNSEDIIKLFNDLNEELKSKNVHGEICIVGGAVMALVFKSRLSTQDVDGIFEPKTVIYDSAKKVASNNDVQIDWLNDGVKGFLSSKSQFDVYLELSNLDVKTASAEYMLAMKVLSSRTDSDNDRSDIKFLLSYLDIKTYEEVERIVLNYYPPRLFEAKCKYFVMELLDEVLYG